MSIGGYKIRDKGAIHFLTFAVVEWVDVLTRKAYRNIVVDSLRHCQEQKGLLLHGWCIMSNHVHLLPPARENNLSEVLLDFKKFTSKQLLQLFRPMSREAGSNECSTFSSNRAKKTAGIKRFNSGSKKIVRRNVTVLSLLYRS